MTPRIVLCLTLCLWATAAPRSQQAPTFTSGVEAVRVDVLVSRGGIPVTGLSAGDFELRDEGVVQHIDHASFEDIPLNVVLALDASASVAGARMVNLRAASRNLLDSLKAGDHAALVTFGDAVVVHSPLTLDRTLIRDALDTVVPLGDTALIDASQAAMLLGESQPGRALIIVFSDGVEVASYLGARAVLDSARRSDAVVYGVSLGVVGSFLKSLTDTSGGELFLIRSSSEIAGAFTKVLDQFRHRYIVSYRPRGVRRGGWHRLDVRAKPDGATVKARPGYLGG
jgi:VWFA-related protein